MTKGTRQRTIQPKVNPMPKIDAYEEEILSAYEEGKLKSVATKAELAKFKAAARATAIKDRTHRCI